MMLSGSECIPNFGRIYLLMVLFDLLLYPQRVGPVTEQGVWLI
jgi:hypothetical protein